MPSEAERHPHFLEEMWSLYVVGSIVFGLRFFVRLRTVGIKGAYGDDYFAFVVWVFYTVDGVAVDRAYRYGTNVDYTLSELQSMSPAQLERVSLGSKYELLAWFSYPALIWATKATMLFFYHRLTFGLRQRRLVKYLAIAVGLTYIGVLLTVCLGCRPFYRNWQVLPQPGLQCSFRLQNVATVSAFNIATDIALLSVPLPLLWHLQIPKKQKIVVAVFLTTGFLVIAAAVIRMVVTLSSEPSTTTINAWGVRETIIALICVNMPTLRPLFTRVFWERSPGGEVQSSRNGRGVTRIANQSERNGNDNGNGKTPSSFHESPVEVGDDANSEEYIMKDMAVRNDGNVRVEVEVRVEREERTGVDPGDAYYWK